MNLRYPYQLLIFMLKILGRVGYFKGTGNTCENIEIVFEIHSEFKGLNARRKLLFFATKRCGNLASVHQNCCGDNITCCGVTCSCSGNCSYCCNNSSH